MTKEEKGRRVWKIVLAIVVLWIVAIPIIAVIALGVWRHEQRKEFQIQKVVPNLIGLDLKTAATKAQEAGFSMEVIGTRSDLEGPLGTIVQQIPGAGESVYLLKIGVVTSVEDPEKKFREEQRKQLSERQKNQRNSR